MSLRRKVFKTCADLGYSVLSSRCHGHLGNVQKTLAAVIGLDFEKGRECTKVTYIPFFNATLFRGEFPKNINVSVHSSCHLLSLPLSFRVCAPCVSSKKATHKRQDTCNSLEKCSLCSGLKPGVQIRRCTAGCSKRGFLGWHYLSNATCLVRPQ